MDQKFVKFEEAVDKLGISAERLHQLREAGDLRAYRDGSSWKFRGDEIERMADEGVPEPSPPSDVGLIDTDELVAAEPLDGNLKDLDDLDDDLKLAEEDELQLADPASAESAVELEKKDAGAPADESSLELAENDDTVTAETSDVRLADESADDADAEGSDSILLSEEELGESVGGTASTIIGKEELASEEADLQLASDDDLEVEGSEIKLDAASGASDVLSSGVKGSGVLDALGSDSAGLSAFEDLDELEIDLDSESSRALGAHAAAAQEKAAEKKAEGGELGVESDLKLVDSDDEGTDPVPEELELETAEASTPGDSDIDLDTGGEDFVLSEGSGSDITLGSGDSGINIVSPSDSGLALDDIPLEMGGSAILSSLSLAGGEDDADVSLVASGAAPASGKGKQAVAAEEDFQLTPLGEADEDDEGDSSSQVIALDAGVEELGASDAGILESDVFAEDGEDAVMLAEDDAMEDADLGVAAYSSGAATRTETDFTVWNVLGLAGCAMLALLSVMMLSDLIRNIDSWQEPYAINSTLLDAVLAKLGLAG